jgi:hypothetical protein
MNETPLAVLDAVETDAIKLERAQKLFELRRRGLSKYECSRQLGLTMEALRKLESETRDRVFANISDSIQEEREHRVNQLNSVIHRANQIFEACYEYSEKLAALGTITRAIATAAKITGLEVANGAPTFNTVNIGQDQLRNLEIVRQSIANARAKNGQ